VKKRRQTNGLKLIAAAAATRTGSFEGKEEEKGAGAEGAAKTDGWR